MRVDLEFARETWNPVFPNRQTQTKESRNCLVQSEPDSLEYRVFHTARILQKKNVKTTEKNTEKIFPGVWFWLVSFTPQFDYSLRVARGGPVVPPTPHVFPAHESLNDG
jgi:hypothetical protein